MNKTMLIQRLIKPRGFNPFSFGGGGGKFSKAAMEMLHPILSFDYMGASEYEWGAVPEAFLMLSRYAEAKTLFRITRDIKLSEIKGEQLLFRDQTKRTWAGCPLYIIGNQADQEEIERRVLLIATDEGACMHGKGKRREYPEGIRLRDSTRLDRYITVDPSDDHGPVGWIELDNGFFFSVDEEMTNKMWEMLQQFAPEEVADGNAATAG